MHYLIARYAVDHPIILMDPWAKTMFTLIALPFAQFGIKGMMFMNICCAVLSAIMVYKILQHFKVSFPWMGAIILTLCTYYFKLMYSGLTEHLFSLVLISSVYLLIKKKWTWGTLLLSTLPFFRQEGYIIIASLLPYYLIQKKIRVLPLLTVTFLLIAFIGGFLYNNPLWIFESNPYGLHQSYGSGHWYMFGIHLYYNTGLINLCLFLLGLLVLFIKLVRGKEKQSKPILLTIFFPFLAFFLAHSIFWTFGIFHSLGLQRVLNAIMPLFAVIAGVGFSGVLKWINNTKAQIAFKILLILGVFIYPFTNSNSCVHPNEDFRPTQMEDVMLTATNYIKSNYEAPFVYADHPLVPLLLEIDPFDEQRFAQIGSVQPGFFRNSSIIVWENHFSVTEGPLSLNSIMESQNVEIIFDGTSNNGVHHVAVLKVD